MGIPITVAAVEDFPGVVASQDEVQNQELKHQAVEASPDEEVHPAFPDELAEEQEALSSLAQVEAAPLVSEPQTAVEASGTAGVAAEPQKEMGPAAEGPVPLVV